MPALNKNLKYTGTYYDASVHEPERLALDVLKDGLGRRRPATPAAPTTSRPSAPATAACSCATSSPATSSPSRPTSSINASGPWTDLTNEVLGAESQYMGGTKGSHIVVDSPELLKATNGREIFFENNDGRIVLIYPLKGRVLIGTTDLEADMARARRLHRGRGRLLLRPGQARLPRRSTITARHIVYRYSGVRPLPKHDDLAAGFVSRDYRIVETEVACAAEVEGAQPRRRQVDHLPRPVGAPVDRGHDAPRRGTHRRHDRHADRRRQGLPDDLPGDRARWIAAHADGLDRDQVDRLLTRYGTRAESVIETLLDQPSEALASDPELTAAEIAYFAEHEDAVHLIDVVLRRTNLAFVGGRHHRAADRDRRACCRARSAGATTSATPRSRTPSRSCARLHGVEVASQHVPASAPAATPAP